MTAPEATSAPPYAGDRLVMEVVGLDGRAREVAFKFRRDVVEVWHAEHCCAALDRDLLREWLVCPWGPLVVDEVELAARTDDDVELGLPGVAGWTIAPAALARLRERV